MVYTPLIHQRGEVYEGDYQVLMGDAGDSELSTADGDMPGGVVAEHLLVGHLRSGHLRSGHLRPGHNPGADCDDTKVCTPVGVIGTPDDANGSAD